MFPCFVKTDNKMTTNALNNAPYKPHTWLRYIDDIFVIWTEGLDKLRIFIDYLNSIHPTIKFSSSHSQFDRKSVV